MKRVDALEKAQRAVNAQYPRAEEMVGDIPITSGPMETVAILEAFGLIKTNEPLPKTHFVPALSFASTRGNISAQVNEDTLVETLRMAGYNVERKAIDAHQEAEHVLSEFATSVNPVRYGDSKHCISGWLGHVGAGKIVDFLLTKGFRITRCA